MATPKPLNRYLAQYRHEADQVDVTAQTSDDPAALTSAALTGTITGSPNGEMEDLEPIALSTSGGNTYADAATNTAVNTAITAFNLQMEELQVALNANTVDVGVVHAEVVNFIADVTEMKTQMAAFILSLKNAGIMQNHGDA